MWFLLLGLPGIFAYKAINTANSMIGHLNDRYRDFGWAAARADDLVNLPASRIAALALALAAPLAGGGIIASLKRALTDAGKHRSPNAGWPEAAMAGALGLALAGPRRYGGVVVSDPFLNEGGRLGAMPEDIGRALRVYLGANAALILLVVATAVVRGVRGVASDRKQAIDVEVGFEMRRQRVERLFDQRIVAHRRSTRRATARNARRKASLAKAP